MYPYMILLMIRVTVYNQLTGMKRNKMGAKRYVWLLTKLRFNYVAEVQLSPLSERNMHQDKL